MKKTEKLQESKVLNKKIVKAKDKILIVLKKYSIIPFIAIGIALFFLSMMLTAQMKTMSETEKIIQGKRESQLADDLINLQRKFDDIKKKYDDNYKIVEEYQNNSSTNDQLIASMKRQIEELALISGTTDVKGEGVVITLNDGVKATDPDINSDSLVHDTDILTVVNELKAAGAEAISVNGQRIVSSSAIRCVGPVIQVNYQKVAAPFEIKAIGNAQYLESAMNIKNGVADMIRIAGVEVKVVRQSEIKIPKFDGTRSFENVKVDNK